MCLGVVFEFEGEVIGADSKPGGAGRVMDANKVRNKDHYRLHWLKRKFAGFEVFFDSFPKLYHAKNPP